MPSRISPGSAESAYVSTRLPPLCETMWAIPRDMATRWATVALAVLSVLLLSPAAVLAQGGDDLGKVLAAQPNMTTFLGLFKVSAFRPALV